MSALSDVENLRLHDISDGDVRDDPRWLALMGEGAVKAFLAEMAAKHLGDEKRYNPDQPRARDGRWTDGAPGAAVSAAAEAFGDLAAFADLDVAEGESRRNRAATEKVANGAAKRLADKWDVSDDDLEKVLREEGAWSHFENMTPQERREGYVRRLLTDWNGGSGGPIPTAAITAVADDRGLDYALEGAEQRRNTFIRSNPALSRVAESLGKAMYEQTQDWFAERGITHVQAGRTTRGADFDSTRPFTSWSLGEHGSAFVSGATERENRSEVIPVERIFSIPPTGFGNMEEAELIVLPEGKAKSQSGRRHRVKRFNPNQLRDSEGQWTDGTPGVDVIPGDKLKLAGRIDLKPGEKLLSSQRIRTRADADGWDLMTAEVDTPNGRQVRLGIIHPEDSKHWTAGPDPKRARRIAELEAEIERLDAIPDADVTDEQAEHYDELHSELGELREFDRGNINRTAVITPSSAAAVRADLDAGIDQARAWSKSWKKYWDDHQADADEQVRLHKLGNRRTPEQEAEFARLAAMFEEIGDPDPTFIEGSVPGGPEGDLHYHVGGTDDGEGGWRIDLGIKPLDAEEPWFIGEDDDAARFDGADVKKLIKALEELSGDQSKSFRDTQGKHPGHSPQSVHGRRRRAPVVEVPDLAAPLPTARSTRQPRRAPRPKPPKAPTSRRSSITSTPAYEGPAWKLPKGVSRRDYDEFRELVRQERALGSEMDDDDSDRLWDLRDELPKSVQVRALQDVKIDQAFDEFRRVHAPDADPDELRERMRGDVEKAVSGKKIAIRMSEIALQRMLTDGRYKTQFESGLSSGLLRPEYRMVVEGAVFGLPEEGFDPSLRPVYGYVAADGVRTPGDAPEHFGDAGDALSQYGKIQVLLRDDVRSRTTAMFGDSLSQADFGRPSPVDKPDWRSFNPAPPAPGNRGLSTLDRDVSSEEFLANTYVEAQIHGGVTVDDVAEVVLPEPPTGPLRKQLEQSGVTWRVLGGDR